MTNTKKPIKLDGLTYELTFEQLKRLALHSYLPACIDLDNHHDITGQHIDRFGYLHDIGAEFEQDHDRSRYGFARLVEDARERLFEYSNSQQVWDQSTWEEMSDDTPF